MEIKTFSLDNLYVVCPSLVTDKYTEKLVLTKREQKVVKLVQIPMNITIGEYNQERQLFHAIDCNKIKKNLEEPVDNLEYGKYYANIFDGDIVNLYNYLWNFDTTHLNDKIEISKYIFNLKGEYTYNELLEISSILKSIAPYQQQKNKVYRKIIKK